jgi:hypothetical protein
MQKSTEFKREFVKSASVGVATHRVCAIKTNDSDE